MKSFSVTFPGDAQKLLQIAHDMARRFGAKLEGDTSGGTFSGHGVEGTYQIEGQTVTFNVARKPVFVPWSLIESTVREVVKKM